MDLFKKKQVKWQEYLKLPSEAPFAWLVYLFLALLFEGLRAHFSDRDQFFPALLFSLLSIASFIYFFVQLYSNYQNYKDK